MSEQDEISLEQAAEVAGIKPRLVNDDVPESERPSNQPGAEATATLEAMLAAGRAGKTVR